MQTLQEKYDVAIIGGGLAGLSLSIQLARQGYSVALFEKEKYPFHKVCGEYISLESWNFLQQAGLPLEKMDLPIIDTFQLSAPNGKTFTTKLPLGGFGISRYTIDHLLATIARQQGVTILEETKVEDVKFDGHSQLQFKAVNMAQTAITAQVCCGAFGKRSNLDVKWKRPFINKKDPRINNYVGVKYHVKTDWPHNLIALHNFKDGYCGISKIEGDKYCLCYLTTAENLKKSGNSIDSLEQQILYQNPALKIIFQNSDFEKDFPLTIAQISFSQKNQVEHHVVMLGDAAGMIAPLCGNGMSMALHSSKIASGFISQFLDGKISRETLEEDYQKKWSQIFSNRLATGRMLQGFFGRNLTSNLFVAAINTFPFLAGYVIKKTHGQSF
jgi:flavin-dependent dehydrogenase